MNLLISNHCQRNCKFCFARSKTGQAQTEEDATRMSVAQIHAIMDFLAASGDNNLRLLGGEPTLHPQLKTIVDDALARDFHVHLFSNCMMSPSVADFLSQKPVERLSILANVSENSSDTDRQKERVAYALERLGPRVQVGVTLTSPGLDYGYLIELIDRYRLRRRIRIGIAQPIVGHANSYLHPSQYRQAGRTLVEMARQCIEQDILIGFDCGLTLCMFAEEDFGVLARCSEGFKSICQPIIDVGPDMAVWHCFPLADVLNSSLDRFGNRKDINRFYNQVTTPYRAFGCMPECMRCDYLRRGQCTGGCLAHAMNSFDRQPPRQVA